MVGCIEDENDTMELFSRAVKLLKLDNRTKVVNPNFTNTTTKKPTINIKKKTVNGMKIGQFVQESFRKAYEQNLLSKTGIGSLQKKGYSHKTFHLNIEVLRDINKTIQDEYGRNRYYAREVFCNNYRLTSQWVESQWDLLLDWLNKIGFDYKNNTP